MRAFDARTEVAVLLRRPHALALLLALAGGVALPEAARAQPESPATAPAPREDEPPLFWALDRMLAGVEARAAAPAADATSPEARFSPGRRVTVTDASSGMNVAAAEVLEVLEGDRYRVRIGREVREVTGSELRRLNLTYVIPDGARVLPGSSRRSTSATSVVDRPHDPALQAFLERAAEVAGRHRSDMAKLEALTKLVNEVLVYPKAEDAEYRRLDEGRRGHERHFGEFLELGRGKCRHMALAMKLALDHVGIASRYVAGEALARGDRSVRGGHAWVEALASDGRRVLLVDPTWHDPGIPLERAYASKELRRPKPDANRIVPPGERNPVDAEALAKLTEPYRRPVDQTLDWRRMARDGLLREGGALAHFGLALFLKELAVVARTGDRDRIEEFFDGLLSTDFYVHYGLFVAGARVSEVAYVRYLQRYVRPRFVNGLLKTNLVLGAGMALPLLVEGQLEGKTFAISLGSLGLSSAAVRAGVRSIGWVTDLATARRSGALARLGATGGRLARLGGWFYTAVELAVVLYVAEELDQAVNERLDREAAEDALADAVERLIAVASDPDATPEAVSEAARAHEAAWVDYRNSLLGILEQDEALLARRLERIAREAKLIADRRRAEEERLGERAALRANIERRYGSIEAYAAARRAEEERDLQAEVDRLLSSYERARSQHLAEVYEGERRTGGYLPADAEWLLSGARVGGPGDPYGGRRDVFARLGRERQRGAHRSALEGAARNRLQAYEDEREVLDGLIARLEASGRATQATALQSARARVDRLAEADRRLYEGGGLLDLGPQPGAVGALEGALDGR